MGRRSVPQAAPVARYQSAYRGERYPTCGNEQLPHQDRYHYQTREPIVREHYQEQRRWLKQQRPNGKDKGNERNGHHNYKGNDGKARRNAPNESSCTRSSAETLYRAPAQAMFGIERTTSATIDSLSSSVDRSPSGRHFAVMSCAMDCEQSATSDKAYPGALSPRVSRTPTCLANDESGS